MSISKVILSSRCKDGSLIQEYHLTIPVTDEDIVLLGEYGEVILKNIGGTCLFTFTTDIVSLKGMITDTVIYAAHRKEETESVRRLMHELFG